MALEDQHPWLRQAWDYATKSGIYVDLDYEFELRVTDGGSPHVNVRCVFSTSEQPLSRCWPVELVMTSTYLTDDFLIGGYASILRRTMAHELAHVYTYSSTISRDGTEDPRPDLSAIASLYFHKEHECRAGPPAELLADTMEVIAYPSSWGGYWSSCGHRTNRSAGSQGRCQEYALGRVSRLA